MLSFDYAPRLLKAIIDLELKRHLVGCDAGGIRQIYEQNLQGTEYVGQEGIAAWGTAAIDVALWDLLGKRLDVPCAQLFGSAARAVRSTAAAAGFPTTTKNLSTKYPVMWPEVLAVSK
jgi:L-alanine-DL-glutamate epimerase-like enolase superfamily enzyme